MSPNVFWNVITALVCVFVVGAMLCGIGAYNNENSTRKRKFMAVSMGLSILLCAASFAINVRSLRDDWTVTVVPHGVLLDANTGAIRGKTNNDSALWAWSPTAFGKTVEVFPSAQFAADKLATFADLPDGRHGHLHSMQAHITLTASPAADLLAAEYKKEGIVVEPKNATINAWLATEWQRFLDESSAVAKLRYTETEQEHFQEIVAEEFTPRIKHRWGGLFVLPQVSFTRTTSVN